MNRYSLTLMLIIILLGFNSCTNGNLHNGSSNAGETSDKGGTKNTTPSPTATNMTSDSMPSPVVTPTGESASSSNRESEGNVIHITDGNFEEEVLRSRMPVLIHFWAPGSAPDRTNAPMLGAVASQYAGRVKVGKVNVDENAELAKKLNVKGIPTIIVIKNGSEQERLVGATSEEAIGRMLDEQLSSKP